MGSKFVVSLACVGLLLSGMSAGGAVIVLPSDAIAAEETGARELSEHLEKLTGGERFPIIREAAWDGEAPMLAVGFNGRLPAGLSEYAKDVYGPEETLLASDGRHLLLSGGRPRGALYAVYEYLEELGVRWFTPTETFFPAPRPFSMPAAFMRRYTSPFRSRTNVTGNGVTAEWCARNRLNSLNEWGNPGEAYGGGVSQGPDMHTFWRIFNPALFGEHPEWAAMVDGKRETKVANTAWGLCLSSPDLRKYLIERTLAYARSKPGLTDVWIGQNDGSPYCTCAKCQAFYDAHGGEPSSLIVQLLNELAVKVSEEFPDMRVKTLAYSWSRKAPSNMKLEPNVTVMFCAHGSYFASLDSDEESCVRVNQDYQGWKALGGEYEVYLYSYPTDNSWFPAPCLYSQARNFKWAHRVGIRCVHQEIFGVGTGNGGDLVDLRAWLYTRLAWRPEADIQGLVEDFCLKYYGPEGGKALLEALAETHRDVEAGKLPPSGNSTWLVPGYVDVPLAVELSRRLESVYLGMKDPVLRRRFGYAILPWQWAEFWSRIGSVGELDESSGRWGIRVSDRARQKELGARIRALMIENKAGTLRLGHAMNPHQLRLAEMMDDFEAVSLTDGKLSVVVLPGFFGKIVKLERKEDGFDPLKPMWGYASCEYPKFGYWREYVCDLELPRYVVSRRGDDFVELSGVLPVGNVRKVLHVRDGRLELELSLVASKSVEASLKTLPLFDMNEDCLGLYPRMETGLVDGTNREFIFGKLGAMWYQAAGMDGTNANGSYRLVSQDGKKSISFKVQPSVGLSYMYDRYNFLPEGTGRILELTFKTPVTKLKPGEELSLKVELGL